MISGVTPFVMLLALAAAPALTPGLHGGLRLARDGSANTLSGHFSGSTGEGKFSCIVRLQGREGEGATVEVEVESQGWKPKSAFS